MSTEYLKIGARGWRHQQWQGSYYPDDLPENWQLSYYANDFQVVLVPSEYWDSSKGYDLAQWLEAVDDDFRFYLECPMIDDSNELQRFKKQCVEMGDLLGGIVVSKVMDSKHLALLCPIIVLSSFDDTAVCADMLANDLDDLRKIRAWLEAFDKQCDSKQSLVFVSNGKDIDIPMETLVKIKTLSEMMGL